MSMSARSATRLLLQGIAGPLQLAESDWEYVLRLARMSGLHGRLAAANKDNPALPAPIRRHLLSAERMCAFNQQMLKGELSSLAELCDGQFPVVLLKGSAYFLQGHAFTRGRFVSDVDLLVPREHLRSMEQRLRSAGWKPAELDPYDERYYRDWSHETPPMRFPGHFLEVDLHHAITPVTTRLRFDPAPLFETSQALPGTPFRALSLEDQVLHACLHCFQDGDLSLRLREVADIDGLLQSAAGLHGFAECLADRAARLGLQRPLWYGLHFAHAWMGTLQAQEVLARLEAPPAVCRAAMERLVPLAMLPSDPDFPPSAGVHLARLAMLTRYHLQRMPLRMLLPHLARKAGLRMRSRFAGHAPAQNA
ncbi:nucleotidyltransferase domain-containing protein [Thauera sp. Sel9]|uniref:nucleotidyltransferase domain-containing protein n=1 Tax=Thauera sp. Sel9 TaxID=2974299 RepID=UPI0021E1AC8E|nr:nucleotidyltransferase family protein [Thauera sp. Sel9]MCV2218823.1 nucleotidyltransferase family protein [Thauera sp. Sel9]